MMMMMAIVFVRDPPASYVRPQSQTWVAFEFYFLLYVYFYSLIISILSMDDETSLKVQLVNKQPTNQPMQAFQSSA